MCVWKVSLSTVALAVAAGWPMAAMAQEAATAAPPLAEATELPEMVVEAPAKRNVKKAKLRQSTPPRSAGQGASQAASAASTQALEQQVVEGEKVVRTVRDTTTSVGVVTGQNIAERQIRDLEEAIEQTANVVTTKDPNAGFAIRGLNSEGQTGLQHISGVPVIGVVIDGVTQNPDAMRRGARGLWDVEQVEVLRGPQSTLQGRNSLGGSVNVKTNDPTYKLGAIVEGTVGTNDLKAGGFVLNAPIVTRQSAFRFSGYTTAREKGIKYADPTNEEMGIDEYDTLRGKLLIEPDSLPGFSALFTVARTTDRPGTSQVTGPDFNAREFGQSAAFTDFRDATADNYSADLSYEFAPGLTVRSITSYADTETVIKTSEDAAFVRRGDNTVGNDFTQDVRLEISNEGNGLSGVVGAFYGQFDRDAFNNQFAYLPFFGLPIDATVLYTNGNITSETTSIAGYADLRYRLDRWSFIGGGRVLRDEVRSRSNGTQLDLTGFFEPVPVVRYLALNENSKSTFNEFLPKVGVTYDLASNQTIGVTYNKGYRAGFTQLTEAGDYVPVAPEHLDAYEVSYRSHWLNKTLEFNSNAFYYDYTDQQVFRLDRFNRPEIANAGNSHAYGAEFEARWRPIPPLQLFAALGLMQSEFDELLIRGSSGNVDASGNEYPEAPAYTISAGAMYRSPSGWFAGANVRHTDGYYTTNGVLNDPASLVDGYTLVDARVGYEWEHYTLTVFAKNLFDEEYLTAVLRTQDAAWVGDERLVGVTLTGRF